MVVRRAPAVDGGPSSFSDLRWLLDAEAHVLDAERADALLPRLRREAAVDVSLSTTSATADTWSPSRRFITFTPCEARP